MKKFQINKTPFSFPLGRRGEMLACDYLVKEGLRIVERNYKCPLGEIDIIAKDPGGRVVFVEVKTRKSHHFGAPEEAVDLRKCRKLAKLALFYLKQAGNAGAGCSFAVISVTWREPAPEIKFIPNAFTLDDLDTED